MRGALPSVALERLAVGIQIVPDQDDGPAELLVGGVQKPGVVRLGEAFARVAASRSLAPASISSAAASRTCSRRARLRGQPAAIGIPHDSGIAQVRHRYQGR